jgi:hypothetical protein
VRKLSIEGWFFSPEMHEANFTAVTRIIVCSTGSFQRVENER